LHTPLLTAAAWSLGSARRPRDHSQPLGSGLAPTARGSEPAGEICGGIYRPCFPTRRVPHARLGFDASGSNFWRGIQVRTQGRYFWMASQKNRCSQPRFCTVDRERPNLSELTSHPCTGPTALLLYRIYTWNMLALVLYTPACEPACIPTCCMFLLHRVPVVVYMLYRV
jgi:hypothetical protein